MNYINFWGSVWCIIWLILMIFIKRVCSMVLFFIFVFVSVSSSYLMAKWFLFARAVYQIHPYINFICCKCCQRVGKKTSWSAVWGVSYFVCLSSEHADNIEVRRMYIYIHIHICLVWDTICNALLFHVFNDKRKHRKLFTAHLNVKCVFFSLSLSLSLSPCPCPSLCLCACKYKYKCVWAFATDTFLPEMMLRQ